MRTIKFRGKRLDNGEWEYGNYVAYKEDDGEDVHCIVSRERNQIGASLDFAPVDPETVGQFTGLLDMNGKEIYEGDIIIIPNTYMWYDKGVLNYIGVVEWIYSQWQVVAHCVNPLKSGISSGFNEGLNDTGWSEGENTKWQIIGNIHDNPELLKTK